jgi:hypothetical protein
MKHLHLIAVALLLAVLSACGAAQDIVYKDPEIARYKTGNRVMLASGSLVSDVVLIEMLKQGKFVLAGTSSEAPEEAKSAAAPAAHGKAGATAAAPAPAKVAAAPASEGGYDYVFRVNALVYSYLPALNALGVRYSFSVTTKTGEIVYIRVIAGGDLKTSIAGTFAEVASLLL